MYKIIALIGEAGSGKDTMMQKVLERASLHEIVSCTTRPKRENEIEGVNYFYLTEAEFNNKVLHNEMLESTCFNNWYYGTSYDSLDSNMINIGVFNPEGVGLLLEREDIDIQVFYIKVSDKTRLLRQLNREENPNVEEIIRRFNTDQQDFMNLPFSYIVLKNETYDDLIAGVDEILFQLKSKSAQGQK